jgi:hypothetical protein
MLAFLAAFPDRHVLSFLASVKKRFSSSSPLAYFLFFTSAAGSARER